MKALNIPTKITAGILKNIQIWYQNIEKYFFKEDQEKLNNLLL